VVSSAPQTFYGQNVVLTATFSATEVDSFPMTGTVSFYDGSTFLGIVALVSSANANTNNIANALITPGLTPDVAPTVSGHASLPTTALSVGNHIIKAVYSGDINYSSATSDTPVTVEVQHTVTSTTLAADTATNGAIVLKATVVVTSPGDPSTAGTVSFYDNSVLIGTSVVNNGVASYNLGIPSAGSHVYSAVFSGGGSSAASNSSGTVTITPLVTGTVFLDLDASGVLKPGDPGLAGRVVFLDLNHDGHLDPGDPTTTTDPSGKFTLSGTANGSAQVLEVPSQDNSDRYVVDQIQTTTGGVINIGVAPISSIAPVNVIPSPFSKSPSPNPDIAFVQSLYKAVLGRTGAANEVAGWVTLMNAGLGRQQVAQAFINSPEHAVNEVVVYYQEFLHRAPDPNAAYWVEQLVAGVSQERVVEGILDSPEYQAAHPDSTTFVRDLYLDVLGRQGAPTEVASWETLLSSGVGRDEVIAAFVNSPEAIDQIVDSFYTAFLHRQPEKPSGSLIWGIQLQQPNASAGEVASEILASPEFGVDAMTATG
jgi:hypothetical protein